jgi:alkylmercury lyase-like protein
MTNPGDRVETAILRYARWAQPVTAESLAAATGLALEDVRAALAGLHETGAIYLRDGAVLAAYPFSMVPTANRISIAGLTVYANCAVDALAVPPMTDEPANISSMCGHCGGFVTVTMRRDRILHAQPAAPVVFYPDKDCCSPGPAVLTRCPHIQFFCGRDHAAGWQEAYPDLRGALLDLADATAFAGRHFAAAIRAVRGEIRGGGGALHEPHRRT